MGSRIDKVIGEQEWLQPLEEALQEKIRSAFEKCGEAGKDMATFLHGAWLGHPLHPVITDVPIGAWTAALVMDLFDRDEAPSRLSKGAQWAVGIGLWGAIDSALTGIVDWHKISGRPRRVGLVHALFNTAATGLYIGSFLMRRRDRRSAGRKLGYLGFLCAMGGGYLGGSLVFTHKVGVSHAPKTLPGEFVPVLAEGDLPQQSLMRAQAEGTPVVLYRKGEQVLGLAETCAHLGGPLSQGSLDGDSVRCPWHGSRFCLHTGKVLEGPSAHRQPNLECRIHDGQVEVRASR